MICDNCNCSYVVFAYGGDCSDENLVQVKIQDSKREDPFGYGHPAGFKSWKEAVFYFETFLRFNTAWRMEVSYDDWAIVYCFEIRIIGVNFSPEETRRVEECVVSAEHPKGVPKV